MLPSSTLPARRLRRILSPLIEQAARNSLADRYRKRFSARAHAWMLIAHTMSANPSLRQSHAYQRADPAMRRFLGQEGAISFSQLARSSSSRTPEFFEVLLARLLRRVRTQRRHRGVQASELPSAVLLKEVRILDSTFFALCAKLSPWGIWNKRGNSGVRLQTLLDPLDRLPTRMGLELLNTNDSNALGALELSSLEGVTLLFDLGYYCHAHFQRLVEGGVHFVTRLNAQASYQITHERKLPDGELSTPEGDLLLSDETITLGSPNNPHGAVLENVRLIRSKNRKGRIYAFITDRHDLEALEILYLYRKRWQIELFFRWLKRQSGALKPLGHSPEAVWLTVLVAAIVAVVMALSEEWRPKGVTRVSWMRALCVSFSMLRFSG